MALYHCHIKLVQRSKGKSVVAAAAYRSGEKLTNEWDGELHDYTKKSGIVHSEILLPQNAPPTLLNRSELWNSVELFEKQSDAQLARDIEIALPVELNRQEQLALVRAYVNDTFVSVGMCADFALHDKGDGNPHAHILLTLRPLKEDGIWGAKCRKEYDLDENGQRIRSESGAYKSHRIDTTDWNDRGKAELWRSAWSDYVNRSLEQNGIKERVDHRSYKRQGIDKIPSVHMGVAAHQMEQRGTMPAGTTFIPGSLKGADGEPPVMTMPKPISADEGWSVTYRVKVGDTLPTPNPMPNTARTSFTHTVDPSVPNGASSAVMSNTVVTAVNMAAITTTKTVDKAYASLGDVLTYTLNLHNTGNVPANDVVISDVLPSGTKFIPGTVTGATSTPPTLSVKTIPAGETATVTFQVQVEDKVPGPNPIANTASVAFAYVVDPASPGSVRGSSTSPTATTQVSFANVTTAKTVDKTFAELEDVLTYTLPLQNSGNVTANNVVIWRCLMIQPHGCKKC